MTTETTERRNGKWAKITKIAARKWTVALGWDGSIAARRTYNTPTKTLALEYATGWLDD